MKAEESMILPLFCLKKQKSQQFSLLAVVSHHIDQNGGLVGAGVSSFVLLPDMPSMLNTTISVV